MLKGVKYINHINEALNFDTAQIFVQDCDLYDFEWGVASKNDRISGFRRGIKTKSITLVVKGSTWGECNALRDRISDVVEKDTLAVRPGRLFVGRYYLNCYVAESKKTEYVREQGFIKVSLKITTDSAFWIKESITTFGYGVGHKGANLDFNRDFPTDYASNMLGKQLNNTGFVDTNFKIVIYGLCENPGVTIGGHLYQVNASVAVNEYLTVDSVNKTIILTRADGSKENCFCFRNKESYIFKKIPPGASNVSASGNFKFDVVLLEERSEPKWI